MHSRIELFEWDDRNEEHVAQHAVSPAEIEQLLGNLHLVVRNYTHGADRFFLIGRTNGGRYLTVSMEPTDDRGTWRPITAYESSARERQALRKPTG